MALITCARSVHAAGSAAKERKADARICRNVRFSRPIATGGALFESVYSCFGVGAF